MCQFDKGYRVQFSRSHLNSIQENTNIKVLLKQEIHQLSPLDKHLSVTLPPEMSYMYTFRYFEIFAAWYIALISH